MIIPAIDLIGGKVVRLFQGDMLRKPSTAPVRRIVLTCMSAKEPAISIW